MRFFSRYNFITAGLAWVWAHPAEAALRLGLGLMGLVVGWWIRRIILDDALITFRVAENLAYGRGFVYNAGERVQVTTTPLYTILLAAGTWLTGSALRAALWLNLALAGLIPLLMYGVGRRLGGRVTGLTSALLLIFSPLLILAFSMESYLYVALILASMSAYLAERYRLAGLLIGLTALVRGDGALLGASLLTFDTLVYRRLQWRMILPSIGLPLLWYAFATLYYGDPFPATLGAKVAQGEFNWLGRGFLEGFLGYWDDWVREKNLDAFRLMPWLAGLGLIPFLRAERRGLIMVGRDLLYVAAFIGLGVPATEWYYAPVMPGVALLTGRGIQLLADGLNFGLKKGLGGELGSRLYLPVKGLVSLGAVAVLLTAFYPASARIVAHNPDWKAAVYPDTARWIAANTNQAANLATIDIGHLGYWSGRQIIDIVGLAQPDVAAKIAEGDFGYALQHYEPDMVLIGFTWLPEIQSQPWFQETYVPRRTFNYPALAEPLLLLSRRQGVKVQPEAPPAAARQPLDLDFNQQLKLTGYHLNQPLVPGMPLSLTLFWQATAPISLDFTVFVQLVDAADNQIVAQKDSKPQNGFYGTPYWQPGETIIDLHTIHLPLDVSPGSYDLLVGLYEVESGNRLQILDEQGQFQSDHVRLPGVVVLGD
ncbi:MAG: hypothetical protein KDF65_11425 [Anaerolineae bacterium]|nr:hypothetical protein [Anaerolineae bacterium]